MRVAYIHYHLKSGGVTTVIRHQVEELRKKGGEALVLSAPPPPASFPAETVPVPGLEYAPGEEAGTIGDTVAETVAAAISKRWPGGCDVVHVHNPTLGKNTRFPAILQSLQQKGFRLLLQTHDFAEDGRPDNYSGAPYPRDCHYAVINTRDYRILSDAGLKKEGLHLLPNMVSPLEPASGPSPETRFFLYPVRGIRRKNLGEAILLTLFSGPHRHLAVTLPPNSPVDMAAYTDWKNFTKEHRMPVRFEAGLHRKFSTLAAGADFFVTTSITEGFGFSFLEPWTAGKSLHGRKLPGICTDFEARNISLEGMYTRLRVPTSWFDLNGYMNLWRKAVTNACRRFEHALDATAMEDAESALAGGTEIDFGLLNEKYQKQVLRHLLEHPPETIELKRLNPFLDALSAPPAMKNRIRRNRDIVLTDYGADRYGHTLTGIYSKVASTSVSHEIRKDILFSRFMDPGNLSLLKWGTYER